MRSLIWSSAGLSLLGNALLLAWLLFKPGTPALFGAIDNMSQTFLLGLAALLCLNPFQRPGRRHTSPSQPVRAGAPWALLLLGIGIFSECLGQGIYTFYEQVLQQPAPFPSWADAGFLCAYPFLLLGIVLLPTRPLSRLTRSRVFLDGLMLMTAVVTFSWYFILGPTTLQGYDSVFAKVVGAAYPLADLVLVFCLLLLWSRSQVPGLRSVVWLLSFGLAIVVLTDSILDYQTLQNAYATGGLLDLGWPLGYTLIGLAGWAMRRAQTSGKLHTPETTDPATRVSLGRLLLPAVLVPVTGLLVLWVWRTSGGGGPLAGGVYLGGALLIGLVTLRQILALRESQRLNEALQRANSRLAAMATTDPLTELPNHRALSERLEQEVARARRYGHPLSLLFFDADHFKRVNDTYGHGAGDVVLLELGGQVKNLLRSGDTLGRYGGEEFLALLPETPLEGACAVAERVRKAIATHPLALSAVKEGIPMTVSLGVASFPDDGANASELVEQADQAMYWAKRLGRNQVRTARESAQFSSDEALAATASNLERRDAASPDGVSVEQVRAKQLTTIQSLMWLLDLRDQGIFTHSYEVSNLAGAIARELGESEAEVFAITTGALLHDLGKIALPDGILYKAGPLTPAENTLIHQHPALGAQILEVSPFLHHLMPGVAHHHENWDGSGYPDGLSGVAIPFCARIIRVSEAYQAMTTDRPYQRHRSEEEARAELTRCSGTQFDPTIVEATLRVLSRGPIALQDVRPLLPAEENAQLPRQKEASKSG